MPLIADTTVIPFTQFSAKDLGVDIEVVSSTKYLSGGATTLGGLIIDYGTAEGFGHKVKNEMLFNFGAYMTPHVAYMQSLGLETSMPATECRARTPSILPTDCVSCHR